MTVRIILVLTVAMQFAAIAETVMQRANSIIERFYDDPTPDPNSGANNQDICLGRAGYALACYYLDKNKLAADSFISSFQTTYSIPWADTLEFDSEFAMPVLTAILCDDTMNLRMGSQARDDLEYQMWHLIYNRSKVDDAADDVWKIRGSENHDAIHKSSYYLASLALIQAGSPYSAALQLADGHSLETHKKAWEAWWKEYFRQRAREGINCEIATPGYRKYTIASYYNIMLYSDSAVLRDLAKKFIDLIWADAANDYFKSTGFYGSCGTRCYKTNQLYRNDYNSLWLWLYMYNWHDYNNIDISPAVLCAATSSYQIPDIIREISTSDKEMFNYTSRKWGMGEGVVPDPAYPADVNYTVLFDGNNSSNIRRDVCVTDDYIMGAFTLDSSKIYTNLINQNHFMGVICTGNEIGQVQDEDSENPCRDNDLKFYSAPDIVGSKNGFGKTLEFDGIDDYARTETAVWNGHDSVKIEGWFYVADKNRTGWIAEIEGVARLYTSGSGVYFLYWKDNDLADMLTVWCVPNPDPNNPQWLHATAIFDSENGQASLEVAGYPCVTQDVSGRKLKELNSVIEVGADGGTQRYFKGFIDDLRISLPDSTSPLSYTLPLSDEADTVIALWNMDGGLPAGINDRIMVHGIDNVGGNGYCELTGLCQSNCMVFARNNDAYASDGTGIFLHNGNLVENLDISDAYPDGDGWIFTMSGNAYCAIRIATGGFSVTENDEGKIISFTDIWSPGVIQMGQAGLYASYDSFKTSVKNNTWWYGVDAKMGYQAESGDVFRIYRRSDNVPLLNSSTVSVDLNPLKTYDSSYISMLHGRDDVTIKYPGYSDLILDFGYYTEPLRDDYQCIALWHMDAINNNKVADSNDIGRIANDLTLCNGVALMNGKIGNSVSFDGTDDYGTTSSVPWDNYDSVKVEAWVKPDSLSSVRWICDAELVWRVYIQDGYARFVGWMDDDTVFDISAQITTGTGWCHITAKFDELAGVASVEILDGNKTSVDISGRTLKHRVTNIDVGGDRDGSRYLFDGCIDDLKVSFYE